MRMMDNFYLIDYLRHDLNLDPDIIESLKFELDQHIYNYGQQFRYPREIWNKGKIQERFFNRILNTGFRYYQLFFKNRKISNQSGVIVSNAYFTVNEELRKLGFEVFRPLWSPMWSLSGENLTLYNKKLYETTNLLKQGFIKNNFVDLINDKILGVIRKYRQDLMEYYVTKKVHALFIPNDIGFFENLSIKILKEIQIPSFIFLHGLPGRYNIYDENRSDYLIVWGEKIREHYIQTGFDRKKIYVSGHPYYNSYQGNELRFNFDDILLVTKSMNGAQFSDKVRLADRGNLILYLYSIQKVLKVLGVKSVRFRPHPSENPIWYFKFLDPQFFKLDTETLQNSLRRSTLVVGPTSTVFLEAMYHGVNYVIYEPIHENVDLVNFPLVPPFDGSERKVPVAKNEAELQSLLEQRKRIDPSVFHEYVKTPFNLNFIKDLISNYN